MKLPEELLKKIGEATKQVVVNTINKIYEYQIHNSFCPDYYGYPEIFLKGLEEHESFKELKEKIPAFRCGIHFYHTTNYNAPKKYGELLRGTDSQFGINCHSINGFDDLVKLFQENEISRKMIASEEQYINSNVMHYVGNIANRYLYLTKKFAEGEIDIEVIEQLVTEQVIRLFAEQLNVNICVPICLLEFEADEIEITDRISIVKMTEEFQLSRFNAAHFESTQENHLVQCAAYMIRLSGYSVDNKEKESLHNAVTNYWSYPLELIDDLFAAIRIVVGFKTGYGQVLVEPIDWAGDWTTDMLPVYGANIRAFNRKDVDVDFFNYNIEKITNEASELIKEIFSIIREKRADEKHNQQFKKVFIAIQRLNRCMLREADDDTALDAIIGIETLLSGDTHGEITYTISNRMAVVAAMTNQCPYTPADARRAMKIIYGLRSDIVHGRSINKNSKVKIADQEIETKALAVEFLRYSLLFVMKNQEYLDIKNYEVALDKSIGELKKQ